MQRFLWVALLVCLTFAAAASAQAEKRIALLIGNQDYDASVGRLKNPHNDISIVGQAQVAQGFELIPPIMEARRSTILGGVRELVRRLNGAGSDPIGFVYYSGHGAAEKDTNINYLIPIDAKEPGTTAFWDESVKLDDVLRLLDGARSAAKFVVFDACRNELQLPSKDTTKGLVPVAEQQGMFIAYASAPGRTASDRGDKSGPYAAALAAELSKPGLDHLNLFQNVKEIVLASTGGAQQPWESNGLARRIYLTGQAKVSQAPPATIVGSEAKVSQPPPATTVGTEAERAWALVKDSTNVAVLEAFVARYKDTFFADLAKARLQELKGKQSAEPQEAASSPPPREIAHSTTKDIDEAQAQTQTKALWEEEVRRTQGKRTTRLSDFDLNVLGGQIVRKTIGDAATTLSLRATISVSALANDPKWSPVFLIGFESTDKKGFAGIEIQAHHRQTPLIVGTKVRDEAVTGHGHVERFKKTLDLREKLTVEMSWAKEGRLLVRVNGSEYRELARAANLSALKVIVSTGDLGIENLVLGHRR
jgi:uncharacterized caspase-like protein